MAFPYIIQGDNIIVVVDNTTYTVHKSQLNYTSLLDAIKSQDWDAVKNVLDPPKVVLEYGKGNISVQGETLYWKNKKMHNALTDRIVQMMQDGFPIEPMVNFMENLMQNPSKQSVTELYGFLEKCNLPITPDGHFLAFKRVRDSYMDCYTNSALNKPSYLLTNEEKAMLPYTTETGVTVELVDGETVLSMERNEVNDNRDHTCSEGLHFCSKDYLNSFRGERVIILKINPRDVVSIPSDYNDSKGRTCRYVVTGELGVPAEHAFSSSVDDGSTHQSAM